ncbi:N-6 DNA methylase, partial [Caldisericum sp.]|uniref:N-6 DNA methylase n=1 Tax=Caldisericum sp. TaxID=2499687 RepID=UPI003D0B7FA0
KILEKLEIEPVNNESFQIFIASIKTIVEYAGDIESLANWDAPILSNLNKLSFSEIEFLKLEMQKTNLSIKECQVKVQKLIPQEKRKKFAAYYTIQQGTDFMASVVKEFLSSKREKVVLVDPFLGSGSTLTSAIEKIGVEKVEKVWGIEPLPLPALVAYASLLHSMKGKRDAVTVILGDAFEKISKMSSLLVQSKWPKADIILTNPPFTRWKYLEKKYREYLLSVIEKLGYKKYITKKEVSLQTLSMFLCDYILNNNGLLISVLPASTFYTIYGRGYKSLLKEKYGIYAIVENKSRASFSEDSGFKEIIIVAVKGSNKRLTAFTELNEKVEDIAKIITSDKPCMAFDLRTLPRFLDINWVAFFGENKLRDVVVDMFKQGLNKRTLGYWNEIFGKNSIIRGVEMYGPEFFFIPNKYWKILEEKSNFVKIKNENKELVISKEFLIKTLRKPSLYNHKIEADVNTFMLSIPPVDNLPSDLQKYVEWGVNSGTAKPAINAYGKYWYSHVYKQMMTKRPFGQVFLPDKVDLLFKNRSVFANYTRERVAASKNFYIVRNKNETLTKLLIGWFNSTIFISVLALLGRRISETWTRFLENDYLELPIINLNINNEEIVSEIVENVNKILNKHLPPLWEQLNKDYRYKLDLAIAKFIGIKNPERTIEKLYQLLNNLLHKNR